MFKKLFSRKSILTNGPGTTDGREDREEHPRATRVPRTLLRSVRFEGEAPVNLSATGIALDGSKVHAQPGARLRGRLELGGADRPETFAVDLLVIYSGPERVGCRFEGQAEERLRLRGAIQRHVSIEVAALSLHPIASDRLQAEPDGEPRWLVGPDHGSGSTEIHWVERAGRLVRFSISLHGQHLEGAPGTALRFGRIVADDVDRDGHAHDGIHYKGSNLVRWESQVPDEARARFRRLVEAAPALAGHEAARRELLALL